MNAFQSPWFRNQLNHKPFPTIRRIVGFAVLGIVVVQFNACSFVTRDSESYRSDTRSLVSTRSPDIKACYDEELAKNPSMAGSVVVSFRVEKKSGQVLDPVVDTKHSTAPSSLGRCIVQAINGLSLPDPDLRDGEATFTWDFRAQPTSNSNVSMENTTNAVSSNGAEALDASNAASGMSSSVATVVETTDRVSGPAHSSSQMAPAKTVE